jgi:acetyl esterase
MGSKPVQIARVRDVDLAGPGGSIPVRFYDAQETRSSAAPALVFFHGGGLVAGSIETHDGICRSLALSSGAIVMSVDYRLAPEHRFPACLVDAAFAVDWAATEASSLGIDPARIAIGGESAGALLAALVSNGHRPVVAKIKAQLLLCPVIDLAGVFESRREFAKGYLIDAETLARDIAHCMGEGAPASALPSPLRHGSPGLSPPTLIVSAECDPFRDEAAHYAAVLEQSGVQVRHTRHPGMLHSFYGLPALLPQATPALRAAGEQLAELLN